MRTGRHMRVVHRHEDGHVHGRMYGHIDGRVLCADMCVDMCADTCLLHTTHISAHMSTQISLYHCSGRKAAAARRLPHVWFFSPFLVEGEWGRLALLS